tara:strand:- start:378 stop:605 length:228 start_codon:yes stop_codon:yes gene_type:complete
MNQDHLKELKEVIKTLSEKLGELKPRAFHGTGTSHPYTVKATKQQLGPVQIPENELESPPKTTVSVSRAFKKKTQ